MSSKHIYYMCFWGKENRVKLLDKNVPKVYFRRVFNVTFDLSDIVKTLHFSKK